MPKVINPEYPPTLPNTCYCSDSSDDLIYSDSESDCEPEYEYYDAAGRPILDTLIRPPSLAELMLTSAVQDNSFEPFEKRNVTLFTDLKTKQKCPLEFLEKYKTWDEALFQYNEYLKNKKQEQDLKEEEKKKQKQEENFEKAQNDFLKLQMQKLTAKQIGDKLWRENNNYTEKQKKIINEIFMSKLPKFPKATLEKIKEKEKQMSEPMADAKFYTWKKGMTATNTSHTAWGHRRNGGGKGRKETLSQLNSEKAAEERNKMRKERRKNTKEKKEEEESKRKQKIEEIQKNIKQETKKPEIVEEKEETEYQKFKKEELKQMRIKQLEILKSHKQENEDEKPKEIEKRKVEETKWEKVPDKKISKKQKIEKEINECLHSSMSNQSSRSGAIKKLSNMKAGAPNTRLCVSFLKNEKCRHGSRCNFAHSVNELNVIKCVFGEKCRHVESINGKWVNKNARLCAFGHPGEEKNKDLFVKRISEKPKK